MNSARAFPAHANLLLSTSRRLALILLAALTSAATRAQGQSILADTTSLVGDAQVRYDRFDRNLSFVMNAESLTVTSGQGPVRLAVAVGRKLGEYVGDYARLIFVVRSTRLTDRRGLILLAESEKPVTRIITPIRIDDTLVAYPAALSSWNLTPLAKSRQVEARLPDGNEVVVPVALLARGARLLEAMKDTAFVAWAIRRATSESVHAPQGRVGELTFSLDTARAMYLVQSPGSLAKSPSGDELPIVLEVFTGTPVDSTAGLPALSLKFLAKKWAPDADMVRLSAGDSIVTMVGDAVVRGPVTEGYSMVLVTMPLDHLRPLMRALGNKTPIRLEIGAGVAIELTQVQRDYIMLALHAALSRDRLREGLARRGR
jgi:hypothetical protein